MNFISSSSLQSFKLTGLCVCNPWLLITVDLILLSLYLRPLSKLPAITFAVLERQRNRYSGSVLLCDQLQFHFSQHCSPTTGGRNWDMDRYSMARNVCSPPTNSRLIAQSKESERRPSPTSLPERRFVRFAHKVIRNVEYEHLCCPMAEKPPPYQVISN